MLKCRIDEGPDARGKDTDCPEGRDPIVEVATTEGVSKVSKPLDEGAVNRVSRTRVAVTETDSMTGSGGVKVF